MKYRDIRKYCTSLNKSLGMIFSVTRKTSEIDCLLLPPLSSSLCCSALCLGQNL